MRTIAVVTVARSDYGIYLPVLRKITADKTLKLHLIAAGAHLSQEWGETIKAMEADGFKIGDRVEMLLASDSPESVAKSMGLGTIGYAQVYSRLRPDLLLVLGDRFEMHAAVVAALPFKIPVAHIHGGELTYGAIDDSLRHSITKMSHLHFVSTESYARRVQQMGEEPWRVTVSGAPSLDNLRYVKLFSREHFARRFGIDLPEGFLLVTYHPVTLEYEQVERQCRTLLAALKATNRPLLMTLANSDTGGRVINRLMREFALRHPATQVVANLGTQGYFSAMSLAAAMVGNSSSGIIEAASFKLPVVNIGSRQAGRIHGANVINTSYAREQILRGIKRACSPEFRGRLTRLTNPYGDGWAAKRIVEKLRSVKINENLLVKRFHDLKFPKQA
jgi:UDP-N-acetylglucosamine 2-epimerase (non-hydrolysing)/GDP/UDP-N,N'-diacetylbacillosamine 2-epimerase (hydrolysing)